MSRPIVFLHGLETPTNETGQPLGRKARWLRKHLNAHTPALHTREAAEAIQRVRSGATLSLEEHQRIYAGPLSRAKAELPSSDGLVIGSSFGGALLLSLMHSGDWTGPALFLAGAGILLTPFTALPPLSRPALLIHGSRDEVIPLQHSQQLASSSPLAELWVLEGDSHRLDSLYDGTLSKAIEWCLSSSTSTP